MDIQRISTFVTAIALLYIALQIISVYGLSGLVGMGISLVVVATVMAVWFRRKRARRSDG